MSSSARIYEPVPEWPLVSVIVPVRNEEKNIGRCLSCLMAQDYPADRFEVIISDGMSDDRTRSVIQEYATGRMPVRVIDNPGRGRAQGLNIAIKAATGDVIVRVDARSLIGTSYISQCVERLLETGADNVGGTIRPLSEGLTQTAVGLAMSHPFGVGNSQYRLGRRSGFVDHVYLGCFPREVFDRVGSFDETAAVINEDSDMDQRIRVAGGKVYLDANIVTLYQPRETFTDFWKLYCRYGGGRVGTIFKHRGSTSWRYLVAPTFLLTLVVLTVLVFADRIFAIPLLAVLGLYVGTDLLVAWRLSRGRPERGLLWRLALAFPCLHFSWAMGFWKRLLIPQRSGHYWPN